MSFNKITIVGNLGKDPEMKQIGKGKKVCEFTVATNDKRRDKAGETKEVATWFRVTAWDSQAELAAKYLKKGNSVYIEGRLRADKWTDRDGKPHSTLEVSLTDIRFIGGNLRAIEEDNA